MMDLIVRLGRWLRSEAVQVVPEDIAVCEFECRKTTCSSAEWNECRRRLEMTPSGARPSAADQTTTAVSPRRGVAGPALRLPIAREDS
jgi:hypothetical protein